MLLGVNASCPACASSGKFLGAVESCESAYGFSAGGALYECARCGLLYLDKADTSEELAEMYESLPAELLAEVLDRNDFQLARKYIKTLRGGKVLDVGCFRGDFLQTLPDSFERYGIEPSVSARSLAEKNCVTILGDTIETAKTDVQFDAVVMMDVAEHLRNPLEAIRAMQKWLAPAGLLIVSTGNSDSLLWRLARLDYWYYLPQHISFCNPRWFRWVSRELRLPILRMDKFSHSRRAYGRAFVPERWRALCKCLLHAMLRGVGVAPLVASRGSATWPDHIMVVFKNSHSR